jgi:curved DNA-binding protein CbpA
LTHDQARTVLGVSATDPPEAVASAYKKAVFAIHPDRHPDARSAERKRAEKRVAALNEAYAVLRGPQRPSDHGPYSRWRPDFSGSGAPTGRSAADVMDDLLRDVGETLKENKTGFGAMAVALGVMGLAELFKRAKERRT